MEIQLCLFYIIQKDKKLSDIKNKDKLRKYENKPPTWNEGNIFIYNIFDNNIFIYNIFVKNIFVINIFDKNIFASNK